MRERIALEDVGDVFIGGLTNVESACALQGFKIVTLRGTRLHLRTHLLEKSSVCFLIGKHSGHAHLEPVLVGEFVALAIILAGRSHLIERRK